MSSDQRRHLRNVLLIASVGLIAWAVSAFMDARTERLAQEAAAAREQQLAEERLAAKRDALLQRFADGDNDAITAVVKTCIEQSRSSTRYDIWADRRDHKRVAELLRDIHPYDVDRKLAYITLPVMDQNAFMVSLGRESVTRQKSSGESSVVFAVTYVQEGFTGTKEAYGILTCPLTGDRVDNPTIELLYME